MTGPDAQAGTKAAPARNRLSADLRAAIADGRLRAGAKLNERVLCENKGVSRTVVRETLRQLEAEGFVTIEAHKGAVVSEISYNRAEHLFEIRGALESLTCSLCAQRATETQKSDLFQAVEKVERAMQCNALGEVLQAKNDFYEALLNGARNPELSSALRLLHARIQMLRRYSLSAKGRHAQSLAEIREICRAILAGDTEGASLAGCYHVAQARYAAMPRIFEEIRSRRANGD